MSERKWDSGPWRVKRRPNGECRIVAPSDHGGGSIIAVMIQENNADVMAASPELYEACDMALHAFQDGWAINWDDLRRALAKARGEV